MYGNKINDWFENSESTKVDRPPETMDSLTRLQILCPMIDDLNDNWHSLLEAMEKGMVIPVIGSGLLEITDPDHGENRLLYEVVARKLCERYAQQTTLAFEGPWGLHGCVATLLSGGIQSSADKLRRAIANILTALTANASVPALSALASIEAFNLYVGLTCDPLLFQSLKAQDSTAESFAFGIRSDTNARPLDIPVRPKGKLCYQMFGSSENVLDYAIHEGDLLEYLYRLQAGQTRSVKTLLGRLRSSHLLFIGCSIPDWLGRSLLRTVNDDPLPSKSTQEFLADSAEDCSLSTFVSLYSPNTLVFPGSPAEFVNELLSRWRAKHPIHSALPTVPPPPIRTAGTDGPTFFVSYASENRDAASTLAERLLELGAADVWLDQRKLKGGDDWSAKIDEAIRQCDYFLPLLSLEADKRKEGVFWEEWDMALNRAKRIAGAFIVPTLIDCNPAIRQDYQRIGRYLGTEKFWALHLLKAPSGILDEEAENALEGFIAGSGG